VAQGAARRFDQAISSLASEEDQMRARQAGVDEFHIKLDREALVAAVTSQLRKALTGSHQSEA